MSNYLDWQNKISSDRKIVPLFYIADFSISPVDKIIKEEEEKVSLCNYTDVYKNKYITSDLEFMEGSASENEINRFQIQDGDILITKDSESWDDIGIPAMVVGNFENTTVCGYHLALMRPKKNLVNPKFVFYCFESKTHRTQLEIEATGVTRFGIPKDAIGKYKIPLPSLEQQNKIVNYLDREIAKIDALIEKKTKLIALLEEKKKAVINQAVTKGLDTTVAMKDSGIEWLGEIPEHWEVVKLKYLVNKIDELNYADVEHKIAVENIIGFSGKLTNLESFNYEGITTKFKKNDIIFNKLRPYLGKVYLAKEEGGVYGELLVLRPNEKLVSKFLFYVMISTNFIDLVNSSTTGAKMPRASWEDFIKHIDIPLISIDEQQNITDFLEIMLTKNEELSNRLLSSIELLKEKRTTIISAAINGKINLD
ncbi:restriction endonuclease subunit S [Flavobacterium davisii]|uniref:Restriction endonuclease subunit S n=1 Tax=Flavobacterium columnare TaxID=996 RepID=A0A8G0KRP2_9FLAO|nr:restriction endonuclease subunit S [Flavobacterium davisii]QYS88811.1 restriction endonuclease subunit S [Flavobacterium davisii]